MHCSQHTVLVLALLTASHMASCAGSDGALTTRLSQQRKKASVLLKPILEVEEERKNMSPERQYSIECHEYLRGADIDADGNLSMKEFIAFVRGFSIMNGKERAVQISHLRLVMLYNQLLLNTEAEKIRERGFDSDSSIQKGQREATFSCVLHPDGTRECHSSYQPGEARLWIGNGDVDPVAKSAANGKLRGGNWLRSRTRHNDLNHNRELELVCQRVKDLI